MHADRFGRAGRLPLLTGILEIADQFFLFRVDRDHRLVALQERHGGRVDMLELRVAIRMRRALVGFAQRLEPVAEGMQQMANRRRTHAPSVGRQRRGQLRATLAGPPQRRHGIPSRQGLDQQIEGLGQARLGLLDVRTPGPWTTDAPGGVNTVRQLPTPVPNRFARQPGGCRHQRVPPIPDRGRFGRRPQAT